MRFRSRVSVWLQQHSPQERHNAGRRRGVQIRVAYTQTSDYKYDALLQVGLQVWFCCSSGLHLQLTDICFVLQKGKCWTFDAPEGQVRETPVMCLTVL